jgi:hypothetical protein
MNISTIAISGMESVLPLENQSARLKSFDEWQVFRWY